jgi:hypothetical protein
LWLWVEEEKCIPVASFLWYMLCKCSIILLPNVQPVCPTYCFLHFMQLVRWITSLVAQVKRPFKLNVCLLWVEVFVFVTYGQTLHGLLHGRISTSFFLGWVFWSNFALHSTLFRFGGCL